MTTYKLYKGGIENKVCAILRDGKDSIPFEPANVDFQNFKKEVLAGAELQDADGNVMTQEQADDFIKELP
jgi:hypothetical protein